jgi:ribonuclease HI
MDLNVYLDGGVKKLDVHDSRGHGRYSYIVYNDKNQVLARYTTDVNDATVPEMEVTAFVKALDWLVDYCRGNIEKVNFLSDSELLVKWMNGVYRCSAENIKPLITTCRNQVKMLNMKDVKVSIGKINRNDNKAHVGF